MNIRKKIFLSYIILVSIVAFYSLILLIFYMSEKEIDKDISELYHSKEIWNDLLISMNELQINWSDGDTFLHFKEKSENLENILKKMSQSPASEFPGFPYNLNKRKIDLYSTWSIAKGSVREIIDVVESKEFSLISRSLGKNPGLQRLNHLWIEMYYSPNDTDKKDAYVLRQVLDDIEFFPIYSETLNHLFNVIIEETDYLTSYLRTVKNIIVIVFFVVFLFLYMVLAIRFSGSLSQPIINLSMELSSFMGKTLKLDQQSDKDEVTLLTNSVKNLITHYTDLSELARRIALGDTDSPILELNELGVVGNALKDINSYIQELADTSQWIREGKFGAKIRVKSGKDILAENFNIMSQVIEEQITILRNVFEAVEEGIVIVDLYGSILEANNKFLQLTGLDSFVEIDINNKNLGNFFDSGSIPNEIYRNDGNIFYTNIIDLQNDLVPVKIITQVMDESSDKKQKFMIFITNESVKVRMEREKETFRAQAVEAELRALRAQINPHFLFNTLNGIAHLVESGTEEAVTMIEKLSELFRYSLVSTRRITVELSEELNIIKQFIDIEKMRFGDNLIVEYHIDNNVMHYSIPPMLLQPVVENAVKYGADENGGIHIVINIFKEGNSLFITIIDTGYQAVNHHLLLKQKGTGIRNVNRRLMSLYNMPLAFEQNHPQGLKVIIEIPELLR